jgi:hypothetical protein
MTDICHACATAIPGHTTGGGCITMSMQPCMVCGNPTLCVPLDDYGLMLEDGKIVRSRYRIWD